MVEFIKKDDDYIVNFFHFEMNNFENFEAFREYESQHVREHQLDMAHWCIDNVLIRDVQDQCQEHNLDTSNLIWREDNQSSFHKDFRADSLSDILNK